MAKDIVKKEDENQLPAHLQQYAKKEKIGNLDESDRIVPRLSLLQAISPEVTEYDNAKAGTFWHNLATESLGNAVKAIPIIVRKSVILWAPRGDERGILARSMDCVNWDNPNMEWTVKLKGQAQPITWRTMGSVEESGLAEFGSSVPGDPRSNPAASLTYNTMWFLPDYPLYSPVVMINTRSQIKPTQQLYNRIDVRPVAHYAQMWEIGVTQEKGAEGPYFNVAYKMAGYPDEQTAAFTQSLYNRYKDKEWAANDEREDEAKGGGGNSAGRQKEYSEDMASKF